MKTTDPSLIRATVRELCAYTPGEQPQVPGLIKLNTNENPYPPSPKVAEALQRAGADQLRLYPDPVSCKLRAAIARYHGCAVEQVFVGNGSDEVLALCTRAFVEREGSIGYFEPSYSLYPVLAAIQDVATRPVRLAEDFTWQMPVGYAASLFFLANPNAPTSVQYPQATVAAFCERFPGVVVIDEAYVDFADSHCLGLALGRGNVLVARTFSKSFSLAGLRLGYAVGAAPLIEALFKLKDSYNLNRLTQELGLAALADIEHMRGNARRVKDTRERVSKELQRKGFSVTPSATNFLWVRPPGPPAADWYARLRARNILVRYFPGPLTGGYLRISMGTEAEMDALLRAL